VKALRSVIGLEKLVWIKIQPSCDVAGITARYMATVVVCSAMFFFCSIAEKSLACLPAVARIKLGKDNESSQSQKEDKQNTEYFSTRPMHLNQTLDASLC
jgi:hypothetical protein